MSKDMFKGKSSSQIPQDWKDAAKSLHNELKDQVSGVGIGSDGLIVYVEVQSNELSNIISDAQKKVAQGYDYEIKTVGKITAGLA